MKEVMNRILRWHGWSAWLRWSGWKKIFLIHPLLTVTAALVSAIGLMWVFLNGHETNWFAYPVYILAFYALVTLVLHIPSMIRLIRSLIDRNPYTSRYFSSPELRFRLSLYFKQLINFCYGAFKVIIGLVFSSVWLWADGLYNLAQGAIQLIQILRRRKELSLLQQWKSYHLCGWLILVMHLTMIGLIYQMVFMNAFEEYPGYLIFVTALFAFYKLIDAFVDVAKDRKHRVPIDSAVRMLDLSQAFFSMFSLQVAMLHQFEGSAELSGTMNLLTGSAVCLLVTGMGIYMLHRSNRMIKELEREENG